MDPGIEENLESFFAQDYPIFEILFSVADRHDPVCEVVKRLMARYPHVSARLIEGDCNVGPNPKVNNLILSYEQAEHDCMLISDSNTRVTQGHFRRVVSNFGPNVGIVTAVVAGSDASGLGGLLEKIYLNSFYVRGMRLAAAFGVSIVVGKSMFFRRSTMERFGGLRNLGQYVNEDFIAGQAVEKLGLKVKIMAEPIRQIIGQYSFKTFWARHLRWGRIRKSQAPIAFFFEPLLGCFVSAFIGAGLYNYYGGSFCLFFALHTLLWMLSDLILIRRMGDRITLQIVLGWLLRESLAVPMWFHIACGNSIRWRGTALRILPGGLLDLPNSYGSNSHEISMGSCHEQPSN